MNKCIFLLPLVVGCASAPEEPWSSQGGYSAEETSLPSQLGYSDMSPSAYPCTSQVEVIQLNERTISLKVPVECAEFVLPTDIYRKFSFKLDFVQVPEYQHHVVE